MRNTHRCPQCSSLDVVRVPGGVAQSAGVITIGALSSVALTWYVCTACGFTESWVEYPNDLAKLRKKFLTVQPDQS